MQDVRIVIADDHPVVRSGIRDMLERADGLDVVAEAENGEEAIRLVNEHHPDVLLLDVEMPGRSGVEVARQLQGRAGPVRVLALSSYDDQEYVAGLLESGASGYLTKEQAPLLIAEAVRAVARGEVRWFVRPDQEAATAAAAAEDLTGREQDILRFMAEGASNDEIARALHISENTVRSHTTNIYRKLGVASGRQAIAWAWKSGLMGPR